MQVEGYALEYPTNLNFSTMVLSDREIPLVEEETSFDLVEIVSQRAQMPVLVQARVMRARLGCVLIFAESLMP